ncbi:MAG: enoyl-CoA hydratase/isomerase family protein [Desulfobulbaceae bacterium]|nr:enoyl-CoA hydratase/isomerase family protein [Desulfobulbaceae bacterium]
MDYMLIKYEIKGKVAYITLNRPDVLNSFNREMSLEMQEALHSATEDAQVRCILISGEGRAFSAGQDLEEAISGKYDVSDIITRQYNPIISLIRNIPKPVVAAVNGIAAGAGANIALACDIIIASDKASFIQSFSNIGLIPDSGGTYFLPRLVGLAKASALMFLAEKVDAKSAEEMGMIYKTFPAEEFMAEAEAIANHLADRPTKGLALTKHLLNTTIDNDLEKQLEEEMKLQIIASNSYDYKEGVNAFLEKRKPIYKGM